MLKYFSATLFFIPLALLLLMRTSFVQTMSARLLLGYVAQKTEYVIGIEKLKLSLFSGVDFENLQLLSPDGDTILVAGNISVLPAFPSLFSGRLNLRSVHIKDADFRLGIKKNGDEFQFIEFVNALVDSLSSGSPSEHTGTASFKMNIKKLDIENTRFCYFNRNDTAAQEGRSINFSDMDIGKISIQAHDFSLVDDSLHFTVDRMKAYEKAGFELKNAKGVFTVSPVEISLKNSVIVTGGSVLDLDFAMQTRNWESYSDVYDSVTLTAVIRPSVLETGELAFFAPELYGMNNRLKISGDASGTISSFEAARLNISFGHRTVFQGDISMKGLPDFYSSEMDVETERTSTCRSDLEAFRLPSGSIPASKFLPDDEPVVLSGRFKGKFNRFKTDLRFKHHSDKLHLSGEMTPTENGFSLHANVSSGAFNPGSYPGIPKILGEAAFESVADLTADSNFSHYRLKAVSNISFVNIGGVKLDNVRIDNVLHDDTLRFDFAVGDKDLLTHGNALLLLDSVPGLNLDFTLNRADLQALNISGTKNIKMKSEVVADIKGFDPDKLTADVHMNNTLLSFGPDWYKIKEISLKKYNDTTGKLHIFFGSDLARLEMSGAFKPTRLSDDFQKLFDYYFSAGKTNIDSTADPAYLNVNAEFIDPSIIGEQLVKGLEIAPNTTFSASVNFNKHTLISESNSDVVRMGGVDFRDLSVEISPENNSIKGVLNATYVVLKDSTRDDKTVFGMDHFKIKTNLFRDSLHYTVQWKNEDTIRKNFGDIEGNYKTEPDRDIFNVAKLDVYVNDTLWKLNPENRIVSDKNGISIRNFDIYRGASALSLSGKLPSAVTDTLYVNFKNWDLSNFDFLTKMWNFDTDGIIDGGMSLAMNNQHIWFVSDLTVKDLSLNHVLLGDARLLNSWDNNTHSVFIKSQIVRKGNSGMGKVFDLDGFLYPFDQNRNFDIDASFNRFKIKAIEPFLQEYVTELEGKAEGKVSVKGTFEKPVLKGYVDFTRTALKINYLNTKYSFSNKIVFDENKIDFGSMVLYDTLGNHASLTGGLYHDYFSNPRFDLTVHTDKFLFFNTTRRQNDTYFGTAVASGDIKIQGPPDNISLDIEAASQKGTSVTIPLDYTTEILDKDYIVFVPPPADTLSQDTVKVKEVRTTRSAAYDIALRMKIQPNADVKIEMPYDMGNIKSTGNGNLALHTNSKGDFSLVGDYVVEQGEFNFNIQNLVSKRFILTKGGKITWSGDPYEANLNIRGLYTVKTNFSSLGLVVDSSASYKNRLNVNCYVILKGSLSEPVMKFEIDFPELDPDMQRMVYSVLDTTNQALVNQQMISLLVLGSFSFSNASNVSLSSSYYSIITNQLSGLLSQVSKDLDIGINYKPGDDISQEEFEVALSTQLFDNRLIINGNFGMTYDRSNRSASNIVGDVDVNFKLTRDGRWVLKAYNHSNVNSWYYYNNYDKVSPYTQGVGIAYQKDFNRIAELFEGRRKKEKKSDEKTREK